MKNIYGNLLGKVKHDTIFSHLNNKNCCVFQQQPGFDLKWILSKKCTKFPGSSVQDVWWRLLFIE